MEIRKFVTIVDETRMEMGKHLPKPVRKAAAVAVIKNPFPGRYQEDLGELIDIGEDLGALLAARAMDALKAKPGEIESYGKGAIVGVSGEIEHAAAILHPKLGKPFREAVGGGKAIIPQVKKIGPMGTPIDVSLHYKDAAFVRSHFDTMTISVQDVPKEDEIVVVLVVATSGRPLARVGGLKKERAKKENGLR